MAEDTADQLKPEVEPMSRVDRIKAGIVKFVENQLPPAHAERYMRFYDAVQNNLGGKALEISTKLRPTMEKVAQVAGWGTFVGEIALTTAALYGGVQLVLHPELIGAMWAGGVALGEKAVAAGTAAAVGAYHYVEQGVKNIGDRVKGVIDRIKGFPERIPKDDFASPGLPKPDAPEPFGK